MLQVVHAKVMHAGGFQMKHELVKKSELLIVFYLYIRCLKIWADEILKVTALWALMYKVAVNLFWAQHLDKKNENLRALFK